ncbi:bidirectional sugar transporter NEC1-like [Cornus florida]|uniref:bidirectional sugar transporter NEC1-like n=1 Tax=Cornus florida TaxID=4283 RepID=UPI002897DCC2|nr:bidirectional sugar transporter NEC1-like [Cornus florida]
MAVLTLDQLAFIFGLLGNIVSFLVFLAPVPTFYKIYQKKSSEGYQSIPYVVALFSATLLLYYAFIKTNANMIVSINGIGCVIEITYLTLYIIYAPKKGKMFTLSFIFIFNIGVFGLIMLLTTLLVKGPKRVAVVGWICAAINLAVFASPLSIMRQVIRTKSVEFMPFTLSFFLTICATMWFFYGFFVKDFYIALPNVMGFLFGIVQMILYFIYKDTNKDVKMNSKLQHDGTTGTAEMKMNSVVMEINPKSCVDVDDDQQEDAGLEVKVTICEEPKKANESLSFTVKGSLREASF